MEPPNFSLIVHGGAREIIPSDAAECKEGIRLALEAGRNSLAHGGTALDAVEAAIIVLEDWPIFDSGIGGHLNRDGRVQLDAILMDGTTLEAGAVAAVERVKNPVRLARKILESSSHMMLVGPGAELFASENGIPLCDPSDLVTERELALWHRCLTESNAAHGPSRPIPSHGNGTVGAVARDSHGRIAAGTSTGGTTFKFPGRVGDSPLIGCGCYADGEAGGVSSTGHGEAIMKVVMAKMAVEFLRAGKAPQETVKSCVQMLSDRGRGTGGLILLDRLGRPGAAHSTPNMAYGYLQPDGSVFIST